MYTLSDSNGHSGTCRPSVRINSLAVESKHFTKAKYGLVSLHQLLSLYTTLWPHATIYFAALARCGLLERLQTPHGATPSGRGRRWKH